MIQILDDPREIRRRDSQDMLGYLGRFDRQLDQALQIGNQVDLPSIPAGVRSVTVSGMGGSAASGDFLQMVLGRELKVPLWVNRNYGAPGFVGPDTLSLLCSYSGNTEETVSAFRAAHAAGAPIVCISSGGTLARLAREHGHPWARIPGGQPPRSALGFLSFPCLAILSRLSLIPGRDRELAQCLEWVRDRIRAYGPDQAASTNPAKQAARVLHGRIPFVYGSQDRLELAARRWCGQFAENGKATLLLEGPSRNESQ